MAQSYHWRHKRLGERACAVSLRSPASLSSFWGSRRLPAPGFAEADADKAAIRARLAEWTDAFNARDASKSCDLFSAELISTMRGRPDEGRDAVCRRIESTLANRKLSLRYAAKIEEIILSGDLAVVRLVWSLTTRQGAKVVTWEEPGLDVFRREADGKWRIFRFLAFSTARD